MFTYIETAGQTELKQCDYMIQGDHEAIYLKHRPWNITASILTLLVGVISFSMITNHKQTCIIHFIDCRKALHSYFTHHTRKYFGCERRRGLHGGRHVATRVDVLGTTCRPLGLASGKLPSAHMASYEKGRCCQAPPSGETERRPVVGHYGDRSLRKVLTSLHHIASTDNFQIHTTERLRYNTRSTRKRTPYTQYHFQNMLRHPRGRYSLYDGDCNMRQSWLPQFRS